MKFIGTEIHFGREGRVIVDKGNNFEAEGRGM